MVSGAATPPLGNAETPRHRGRRLQRAVDGTLPLGHPQSVVPRGRPGKRLYPSLSGPKKLLLG